MWMSTHTAWGSCSSLGQSQEQTQLLSQSSDEVRGFSFLNRFYLILVNHLQSLFQECSLNTIELSEGKLEETSQCDCSRPTFGHNHVHATGYIQGIPKKQRELPHYTSKINWIALSILLFKLPRIIPFKKNPWRK